MKKILIPTFAAMLLLICDNYARFTGGDKNTYNTRLMSARSAEDVNRVIADATNAASDAQDRAFVESLKTRAPKFGPAPISEQVPPPVPPRGATVTPGQGELGAVEDALRDVLKVASPEDKAVIKQDLGAILR